MDAPNLRDDFYCSVLAFSPICHTLAVGLGNILYTWSEDSGVQWIHGTALDNVWLTSVAFSSDSGRKAILAIGRSDGSLVVKCIQDGLPRFEVRQPHPVACVSWRPICTPRPSKNPMNPGVTVQTEELVVGDEIGVLYYYVVEWPMGWEVSRDTWPGSFTMVAKISIHTQQICGLAWSPDGKLLASGGNDNLCCLLHVSKILNARQHEVDETPIETPTPDLDLNQNHLPSCNELSRQSAHATALSPQYVESIFRESDRSRIVNGRHGRNRCLRTLTSGCERYRWIHGAAVKAIAFCPWRDGLLATGGGSNDKCIHFFHTSSGSALATISVSAQVTALIWSKTRREIAATFGYAQPEHPYRIAIFSWPDCIQVAAIPWEGEWRALYAVPYPGRLPRTKEASRGRTARDGCIVVASSDQSVKFHEVWTSDMKTAVGGTGTLGGSDILESLEGIDKEGDVIR